MIADRTDYGYIIEEYYLQSNEYESARNLYTQKDKCLLHIGIPQVMYAMEAHSREIFMKALLGPSKRMSLSISTPTSAQSIGVGV